MKQLIFILLTITLVAGSKKKVPEPRSYALCNYDNVAYQKCLHLLEIAKNNFVDLALECVQEANRAACLTSVEARKSDMLVVTGHGYQEARRAGLHPVLFERDSNESLYIAVAPRNISLVDVSTATIKVDQNNHRAFHAAAYFNLRRGHDICLYMRSMPDSPSIQIVDSNEYVPSDDEILLCPDRSYAEATDYQRCNFEANLQRAIFISRRVSPRTTFDIYYIVNTILEEFGNNVNSSYNFFSTFNGSDNVIFKNNTVGFDFHPTYQNGFSEVVFNLLHCNTDDQKHDPSQLE